MNKMKRKARGEIRDFISVAFHVKPTPPLRSDVEGSLWLSGWSWLHENNMLPDGDLNLKTVRGGDITVSE